MLVTFNRTAALAATALVALTACDPQVAKLPPPSTDYAKTSTATAKPRGNCLTPDEMQAVRTEITWQQFYNAAIQCKAATPAFAGDYSVFRNKYRADNEMNAAHLQRAAGKARTNINIFKTEIANRDGPSAGGNPQYCANAQQGFRWALSQQVNHLSQVPPLLDFTSDMGLRTCTPGATPSRK